LTGVEDMTARLQAVFAVLPIAALLAASPAPAQPGLSDKGHGRDLAERLCSNCHLASRDAKFSGTQMAPPFPAIANRKDQTPQRLAGAIIIPHPEMPTIQLTMSEIRDIVAYIMSLRTEP